MTTLIDVAGAAALLRHHAERNLTAAPSLARPAERSHAALTGVVTACANAITRAAESQYELDCARADHAAARLDAARSELDRARALFDAYADGTIYSPADRPPL